MVEEVGNAVKHIKPGQFVIGSFFASDNTCPICRAGYQSRCVDARLMGAEGAQAPFLRVPLADGTLVATPDLPPDDLIPSLLAASDVLGTGWFAADAAAAGPGKTVVVVGDGAVGLLGVLTIPLGALPVIVPYVTLWAITRARGAAVPAQPLRRSRTNHVIAGVLGGVAEWLGVRPGLVRVTYSALTLATFGVPGVVTYLVLWAKTKVADDS